MKTTFLLLTMCTLLGGCAENTLIVRGNMPGTAWVAERAVVVSGRVCAENGLRNEQRSAQTTKQNRDTNVEVRHTCAR